MTSPHTAPAAPLRVLLLDHKRLRQDPLVYSLGTLLAAKGHSVECWGYTTGPTDESEDVQDGFRILRYSRGSYDRLPRTLRRAAHFNAFVQKCRSGIRRFDPHAVVVYDYDTLAMARLVGITSEDTIYYATEYSPQPFLSDLAAGWGLLKLAEPRLARRAAARVSVDPERAERQARQWRTEVPPVLPNTPLSDPGVEAKARQRLASRSRPTRIVYAGSIRPANEIESMIRAVSSVDTNCSLDIYGAVLPDFARGFHAALLKAGRSRPGRITYHGELSYPQVGDTLAGYDLGICLYSNSTPNQAMAAPSKLLEYLRAGLAVLCSDQPGPSSVIAENDCGWTAHAGDESDLFRVLRSALSDPCAITRAGLNGLNAFAGSLAYDVRSAELIARIESIGDGARDRAQPQAGGAKQPSEVVAPTPSSSRSIEAMRSDAPPAASGRDVVDIRR